MAYWICQVLGWGLWFGAQSGVSLLSGSATPRALALNLAMAATGLLATHLLRWHLKRSGWLSRKPAAWYLGTRLGGASALTGTLISLAVWAEIVWIGGMPFEQTSFRYFVVGVVTWSAVVALWLALYLGVKIFERVRAAEAAARTAQLDTLRAQLNPHFLFNALNSIRALIAEDPGRAQDAVTELSELLRYTLQKPSTPLVALSEELAGVRHYLKLEQIRYEDRLRVEERIAPEMLGAKIPPMLLQTLVENAIKHGIGRTPGGGVLGIEAKAGRGLELVVTNPGNLGGAEGGGGIGLRNARERLALLAPGGRLELESKEGTVTARVEIPQ